MSGQGAKAAAERVRERIATARTFAPIDEQAVAAIGAVARMDERREVLRRVLEIIEEMQEQWHSSALFELRERIEREIGGGQ